VILETARDERTPIILGRPFLSTTKAIIYADTTKIYFTIKDKEKFSFKDHILYSPTHPQKGIPARRDNNNNQEEKEQKKEKEQDQPVT
jgi:hypothetical protein